MRFTGFDDLAAPETVEVAALLARLQEALSIRGAAARELLAITFDTAAGNIEVVMRQEPLAQNYPKLAVVMGEIARTCAQDGIGASQLRRMLFRDDRVRLDVMDADGKAQSYDYFIRSATLH